MKDWTLPLVVGALAGAALVYFLTGSESASPSGAGHDHMADPSGAEAAPAEAAGEVVWTCSMDPQVQLPAPGDCPICGMALIPLDPAGSGGGAWELALSAEAAARAGIETTVAAEGLAVFELGLVGRVAVDETRVVSLTSWVAGRLDRLYVDYTGVLLRAGDHVAEVYSPMLFAAQEEWLQARSALANLASDAPEFQRTTRASTLDAASERLRQLGVSEAQLAELAERGTPKQHVTVNAPFGGVVTAKRAQEGGYVERGTVIVELADLDHVWVELEAYESDLPALRLGQDVSFRVEGRPGEVFHSRIAWLDPLLYPRTRTATVRLNVQNTSAELKPGTFVRATVDVLLDGRGRAIGADLSDKWLCPMHPDVVRDAPADCPVCGMDLELGAELGLSAAGASVPPLLIPASAVLWTGKRSVVYVEDLSAGPEQRAFLGREVELGPKVGDTYLVLDGLMAGERVVTRGAFVIDSELQIRAKRSMLHPEVGGDVERGVRHIDVEPDARGADGMEASTDSMDSSSTDSMDSSSTDSMDSSSSDSMEAPVVEESSAEGAADAESELDFDASFKAFVEAYLAYEEALAADAYSPLLARGLMETFASVTTTGATPEERAFWEWGRGDLQAAVEAAGRAVGIEPARVALEPLSATMVTAVERFGAPDGIALSVFHCPMAFDNRGASWLARKGPLLNPYFGAMMLRCGRVERETVDAEPRR